MEKNETEYNEGKITLVAFGDIHGGTHNLMELVPVMERADGILFLGDGVSSLEILPRHLNKKLHAVRGNVDFFCKLPDELLVEIGGKTIFMAHGHTYGVKSSHDEIAKMTENYGADLCIYGHSHKYDRVVRKGVEVINVPPIGEKRTDLPGSYLIIEIENGNIKCELERLDKYKG